MEENFYSEESQNSIKKLINSTYLSQLFKLKQRNY